MAHTYVLLSGGMDSTTALASNIATYGAAEVVALSISYGQRHRQELEAAAKIAAYYEVEHKVVTLPQGTLGVGGLTDTSLEIPAKSYDELPWGQSPTYVPFRNGTLLSLAASHAYVDEDANAIVIGAHKDDAENWAYADCTPEFVRAMSKAIHIGTYNRIKVSAPWIDKTKAEIVRDGEALVVPWKMTWSCYEHGDLHCGVCPTCRSRKEAFEQAGVNDPTEYAA